MQALGDTSAGRRRGLFLGSPLWNKEAFSWDPTASRPPSSLVGPGRVARLPQSSSWQDGVALRLRPALLALGSLSKGGWLSGVRLLCEQVGL